MEIIAEIGQNHNGDIDLACRMIRTAKQAGADVAKFQLYDAKRLFPRKGNPWFAYNCRTELSRDAVRRLARECRRVGIEFMASVFDVERIEWLEKVGVRRYKVASRSINDRPLIEAIVRTGKPVIVSLGLWRGRGFPKLPGGKRLSYLYCISKYPAPRVDLGFESVDFSRYAGFSDHTLGTTAAMAAFARGARILEKHFTLDKGMYGPDHRCSMTPDELRQIHRFRTELEQCL